MSSKQIVAHKTRAIRRQEAEARQTEYDKLTRAQQWDRQSIRGRTRLNKRWGTQYDTHLNSVYWKGGK